VESERTVILSEREGNDNEPLMRLDEKMQTQAFDLHPYRNEVIGLAADIKTITRDDLYAHYRRFYAPNNAVLAIAGDFDTPEMIEKIKKTYGHIPASDLIHQVVDQEPALSTARYVEIIGPGETTYLRMTYRAPAGNHADFFAMSVLDSLLSGPSGLNMFGGGNISNKTSRLYRALVEKEITVSVSGDIQATIDPYLYALTMILRSDKTPQDAIKVVDQEITHLQENPVNPEEINRAIKQAKAMFAYGAENITNQGFWLGYAEMFDRYAWFESYVEQMEKVTPEDVMNAARTYLRPDQRVTGVYLPEASKGDAA